MRLADLTGEPALLFRAGRLLRLLSGFRLRVSTAALTELPKISGVTHRLPAMSSFTDLRPALHAADMAGAGGQTARNVGVADGIAHAVNAAAPTAACFGVLERSKNGDAREQCGGGGRANCALHCQSPCRFTWMHLPPWVAAAGAQVHAAVRKISDGDPRKAQQCCILRGRFVGELTSTK